MKKTRFTFTNACKALFIALAACALPLGFSSCGDDDGNGGGDPPGKGEVDNEVGDFDTPAYDEYAAKYEITNEEENGFRSIEFTESGNFIIVAKKGTISFTEPEEAEAADVRQTAPATRVSGWNLSHSAGEMRVGDIIYSVLSGPYTVKGENTYFLDGIGTVRVIHEGKTIYSIEITPINDTAPRVLRSTLYEAKYLYSPKTVSLCRTWDLVHFRYYFIQDHRYVVDLEAPTYGELYYKIDQWQAEEDPEYEPDGTLESYEANAPHRILFSKFGTYVIFYNSGRMNLSSWSWADYARGIIAYSRDNLFDGEGKDGNVTVWFRGNKTYVNEAHGYNNGLSSFEEGFEYTLQEVK